MDVEWDCLKCERFNRDDDAYAENNSVHCIGCGAEHEITPPDRVLAFKVKLIEKTEGS